MFYRRFSWAHLGVLSFLFLSACSDGILGGSITAQFAGINKALVLGPNSVSIDWRLDPKCSSYEIYALTASTTSKLRTASVPPVILNGIEDLIQSETTYSFAVGCRLEGLTTGLDVSASASTWREFDGVISNPESLEGGAFRFTWNYPDDQGTRYLVYAIESLIPGAETRLTKKNPGNYRLGYLDEPLCTTFKNRISIGPGGECNPGPSKLKPGSLYQFHVVAQYPDNNFSNNLAINAKNKLIDPSFEAPNCTLTQMGIGPDSTSTYLYLRCSDNGASNTCGFNNITAHAYQGVPNSSTGGMDRNSVSGDMALNSSQNNILQIQATPGIDPTNERRVKNLEVEYTCRRPGQPVEKMVARYDGTNNRREPLLKYGNSGQQNNYELAPEQSFLVDPRSPNPSLLAPSRMGQSTAVGDFDCDGRPDLAVGLPDISYNQAPYFNENPSSGAVKVYYNYATTADGNITAGNGVQMLTFGDLRASSRFGTTLSAGNINKDVAKSVVDNFESFYSCDDLIVGAPGVVGESTTGRAFVFYGQRQRFPNYPVNSADLPKNSPTCSSSSLIQQNCTPVELSISDFADRFRVNPLTSSRNNSDSFYGLRSLFGYRVAYLRDFNADGYGDIAVSDPNCMWDGYRSNNGLGFGPSGDNAITEVGCIYIYFGGKEGLQSVDVGVVPDPGLNQFFTNSTVTSPYIKVYPPLIQSGMHFGESMAAGGDIDGRLPVPVPVEGSKVILATGYDFVVGAPGFTYATSASIDGGALPAANNLNYLGSNTEDPYTTQAQNITNGNPTQKTTPPLNGAWATSMWANSNAPTPQTIAGASTTQGLINSTGIAFTYFGRSALQDYNLKITSGAGLFPQGNATGIFTLPLNTQFSHLLTLFSGSSRDRQGHRGHLELQESAPADLGRIRPSRSFYNCGVRGSPSIPTSIVSGTNDYGLRIQHYSCLAGRNNFSTLFPSIRQSDTAIRGFGSSLGIAGSQDTNLIAQFHLKDFLGSTSFVETAVDNGTSQLIYNGQGKVHQQIRGYALWEAAVKNFSGESTIAGDLASSSMGTSSSVAAAGIASVKVRRSPLNETLSMDGATVPAGGSRPQMDLNRDGYADIAIGSGVNPTDNRSTLALFYGNYAGDFSYAYHAHLNNSSILPSSTNSSCSTQRGAVLATTGPATNNGLDPTNSSASAFTTFQAQSKTVVGSSSMTVSAEFPQMRLPSAGGWIYFIDGTSASSPAVRATNATAGLSCRPQFRYLTGYQPSAVASSDINGDGMSDFVVGYSGSNNGQGSASVLYGNPFNGVGAESLINTNSAGALFGSSVSATAWKFLLGTNARPYHEHLRRDVWIGAQGRNRGDGAVFAHSSSSTIASDVPLNTSVAGTENPLTDFSNAPNRLYAETSQIVGDVNGDGFDDILVRVKRADQNGLTYFDGMIYFGSPMGPVTNSFCRARVAQMRTQPSGGQSISASECYGSVAGSMSAYIGSTLVRLPQYLERPTGVGANWIRHAFRAGDVNRDGRDDLVLFDSSMSLLYLFFGSESGLVNGEPLWGASSNRNPQKVANSVHIPSSPYQIGIAEDWQDRHAKSATHGDFNGDGYMDFAIGQPYAASPSLSVGSADQDGRWNCTGTTYAGNSSYDGICTGSGNGSALDDFGQVLVFYGGAYGFQIPSKFSTPIDARASTTCENHLTNCSANSSFREVYGSLYYQNLGYNLRWAESGVPSPDQGETTCDPDSPLNNGPRNCSSRMTVIRNPFFHNYAGGVQLLRDQFFGTSVTSGDFNGDGIVDLAVGAPRHELEGWNLTGWPAGPTLYGSAPGNADIAQRGAVFIYYGSKGGVVAPRAQDYYGDLGMGIGTTNLTGIDSRGLFVISPEPWNSTTSVTQPALDASGNLRGFGSNLAIGDFNGDTRADLAVTSNNGQLYVYYGPLCNTDNARSVVRKMYEFPGKSEPHFGEPGSTLIDPGVCKSFRLNGANRISIQVEALTKRQSPQMITITGVNPNLDVKFGSVLISTLPNKGGNINGDPGIFAGDAVVGASDLIIGGGGLAAHDSKIPRVGGRNSGIGYILFGHAAGGAFNSQPGLFTGAPADYNSTIFSTTTNGVTRLHYAPVALRPYEPDGTVGSFFLYNPSIGDLNGDRTGDLVIPTSDLDVAGHQRTPVVSGGGFKLIY